MYSNIYFDRYKSEIHYWEYEGKKKVHTIVPAPLYFFVEGNEEDCDYKTIFGKPAKKLEYSRWSKYKNDREKYKEWGRKIFESDVPIETKFIIDNYHGIDLKIPEFDIHYLDIEVHSEEGFPRAEDARIPITIITTWSTKHKKFFIFAEKDFDTSFMTNNKENFEKKIFSKETEMLEYYCDFIRSEHPDIITGWNSNGYDIPYIMNRIKNLLGEEYLKKISPVENVYERMVPITEYRQEGRWNIGAIYTLDLLEIYKNYTFSEKESWKLDDVAFEELKEKKVEYDGTLSDLYNNDWQKYVEYNIQDVRLLRKLEDKKKFIPLLVTFCYGCRVPLDQYQKTTRVLDGAFISALKSENIVLPDVNRDIGETEYIGGFVKNPIHGLHDWVVSFDATSLYPSIMMNLNISPETKVGKIPDESVKLVMKALSGKVSDENVYFCGERFTCQQFVDFMKDGNYCMSANGVIFRQDVKGVIPRFVEEWFNKRKEYKKKMLEAQAHGNKKKADEYHLRQLNHKILINSVYGFLGTPHSRFFDKENAIAVTLTARYITITSAKSVNHYFESKSWKNNTLFSDGVNDILESSDVVIYADTDSVVGNSIVRLKNDEPITIEELMDNEINKNFNNYKINYDGREFVFPEDLFLPYYCELSKKKKLGKVKYIEKHYSKKDIFRIKTKSGKYVDVTEDHTCVILDNSSLIEVKPKDIIKGQKLIKLSDQEKFEIDEVESVEFLNNDGQYVYDIGMEDTPHTFFANDILVHNSVYIDFGKILKSLKFDYKQYSDEAVKNYIIYNQALDNNTLNIPHGFDLDSMEEAEKDKIIQRLRELEEAEVSANSLQNHVSNIINTAMKNLMTVNFNANDNRISFKREAVAVRGLFLEKKRYVLWALNNEGVELPEKKRLKVTGIDIIRSTTPKFVKEKMKDVIINILKNVDYDQTIQQLREIHDAYWEADPEDITFIKSANGIIKYFDKFKQDGKFKSTPQHVRGSILYNEYLDAHPNLKKKYDKIYDGDKVCVLYTKKGPEWDSDVFVFKGKWVKESNFEEYLDRRRQFDVSMLNPIGKFFDALGWQLPDFENSDMSGLFEW